MSETEYTENGELYPIMIEGLTEKEAAEYKQILGRFLESYKKSDGEQQEFQWLKEQLREELPEKTDQEIEEIKTEIVTSIQEYDNNLKDLKLKDLEDKKASLEHQRDDKLKRVSDKCGIPYSEITESLEKEMFVGPGMNWNVLDMAYEYKKVAC